jgi:type VI secretion system secreted protein Hcp
MPDNFDGFLKIEGITSESKDPEHKGWIDVESFGFGCEVSDFAIGEAGKLVADDPQVQPFTFTQGMHKGSPTLFLYCVTGRQIPTAEFHVRKAGGESGLIYFRAKFTDCLITNVTTNTDGGPLPMETVTLAYRKVELAYQEQNSKTGGAFGGAVQVAYDQAEHAQQEA